MKAFQFFQKRPRFTLHLVGIFMTTDLLEPTHGPGDVDLLYNLQRLYGRRRRSQKLRQRTNKSKPFYLYLPFDPAFVRPIFGFQKRILIWIDWFQNETSISKYGLAKKWDAVLQDRYCPEHGVDRWLLIFTGCPDLHPPTHYEIKEIILKHHYASNWHSE